MKRNIKAKLRELGAGENLQQIVIDDILGKQISLMKRLKGMAVLWKKWENMDTHAGEPMHVFSRWMCQCSLKTTMLKSTRCKAGLGDTPAHFTTNASESMN